MRLSVTLRQMLLRDCFYQELLIIFFYTAFHNISLYMLLYEILVIKYVSF